MAESGESSTFPQRLHHHVPPWVKPGSYFHIRLRVARNNSRPLTQPVLARALLDCVQHYHDRQQWHCLLFLLMPDHAHGLLAFPAEAQLSLSIGNWKRYTAKNHGVLWQPNFFDHRIRPEHSLEEKHAYILQNPVVKGLCGNEADWPWSWHGV